MRKVLITGATGFIGYEVARQLAGRGADARLLVRRPQRAPLVRPLGLELVSGDLLSPPSLERALEGVDTVIHLGARAAFESYRRLAPTIVEGTRTLVDRAVDAGVEQFVFGSSLRVYGSQSRPIGRDTEADPVIDYGRAKLDAERLLSERAAASGLGLGVVRLPHVYGARDLMFERVQAGTLAMVGAGTNAYAHLHVEDAARVLIGCAEQRWRGVSAVGDDRPATWEEFIEVLRWMYPRFRVVKVPKWLASLGTHLLRPLVTLRRRPTLLTPDMVTGWSLELPVEPGLLWDELGLAPRYPTIDEGLPAALDDCVEFRWRHPLADPVPY
ncbi:MAG: NAD-dependent epimerase/dehydratase family protein [Thermoanaerobaculia bacterium]|nr:NAD-dependent epimerase/dehydratase family protein [Thermoanaerobaculia bacterium]